MVSYLFFRPSWIQKTHPRFQQLPHFAFQTFAVRLPGAETVNVGAGEGEAGHRHMAVALSTDDMPFLVDSATAAIGESPCSTRDDADAALLAVSTARKPT